MKEINVSQCLSIDMSVNLLNVITVCKCFISFLYFAFSLSDFKTCNLLLNGPCCAELVGPVTSTNLLHQVIRQKNEHKCHIKKD